MGAEGGGLMARSKKKQKKKQELEKKRKQTTAAIEEKNETPRPKKRKRDFASVKKTWSIIPGKVLVGRVSLDDEKKSKRSGYIRIKIAPSLNARLCLTHIDDAEEWTDSPLSKLKDNQFVKCRVLKDINVDDGEDKVYVSLRPSILGEDDKENGPIEDRLETESEDSVKLPAVGQLVKGFVVGSSKHGCFVRLTRHITALVQLRNLADGYVKDVAATFPYGKLVAGRVINADTKKKQVSLSLKSTAVIGRKAAKWTWENLRVGLKLPGRVRRCEPYGVLVNIEDSERLGGLCYKTEIEDGVNIKDASKLYSQGDRVMVKVLSVDAETKKISLGLKPSYFTKGEKEVENEVDDAENSEDDSEIEDVTENRTILTPVSESDSDDEEEEEEEEESQDDENDSENNSSVSDESNDDRKEKKIKGCELEIAVS
mmetsp:Transcript_15013/g.19708  ORF Transcript_15013/g.19708 Transcript_15013/m.19708 type:complete len:428 (+) Transcript_15013:74-1357(+)